MARIVGRKETRVSPWVTLVDNLVEMEPGKPAESYHCLAQADYVTVVARTPSGRLPLVRQFRAAIAGSTWEFPSGLLEAGEAPDVCAARELEEEAGMLAQRVIPLGTFHPDTGRLENRIHVFAVEASEQVPAFVAEPGMEVALVSPLELRARILSGEFAHQLHLGALTLASLHGFRLGVLESDVPG